MSLNLEQMKLSGFEPDPDLKWEKIGDIAASDDDGALAHVPVIADIDEHRVLVIEKAIDDTSKSFVRVFDTRTREWSDEEWPSLNQTRSGFSCVVCNDKVYVIGGLNINHGILNSIECLDLSASPRRWITMDQTLEPARDNCECVAIGTQVFIVGGYDEEDIRLTSVEILNTETGQFARGPDFPPCHDFAAAAVNNNLLVFSNPIGGDGDISEIRALRQGQPSNSTSIWEMKPFSLQNKSLFSEPIAIGDCVFLSRDSVYDTRRACWWDLPPLPFTSSSVWTLVGGTEIIAFTTKSIYSLKLKYAVQPPMETIVRHTKTTFGSMLFSPNYSDVLFICPDGTEIPAHRNVLAANNSYFQTSFSEPWAEQHPDGRWEMGTSSDVIKSLLSLIYTGEVQMGLSDAHLLELLETVYEFQLDDDLLRVCQAKCIDNIGVSNVKDVLLSAKALNAKFLFDACFEYVCKNFVQLVSDAQFAMDIINVDGGHQLWQEIVQSQSSASSKKRPREESVDE